MSPLRILLGNNTLRLLAGSETWTWTLARQLQKLGHQVHCFSPVLGPVSDRLNAEGIGCHEKFSRLTHLFARFQRRYDLIIANHHHIVERLRRTFPRTPLISTVHGILHKTKDASGREERMPEHPALEARVGQFVAVSEEVQALLKRDFGLDSVVVRNFFDFDYLKPAASAAPRPRRILFNSNYNQPYSPEVDVVRKVASLLGADLSLVGVNHSTVLDIRPSLEAADIVVGVGRSVLEGVALGRLGIVHGHWGTGGVICAEQVEALRRCNFSGRNSNGKMMPPEDLARLIERHYSPANAEWGMRYVRDEHNVTHAADRYLQLGRELLAKGS